MKVVILAGGFGTRLSEETKSIPKPMVKIGTMPIIWHIMKHYSYYGYNDFIIATNKLNNSLVLKKFFHDYMLLGNDICFDYHLNQVTNISKSTEDWKVQIIDTGSQTETAGRIAKLRNYIGNETFMATYGDGVSTVNIDKLLSTHIQSKGIATLTAVKPTARFGYLNLENNMVTDFIEKHPDQEAYINSGYFVFEPQVFDYFEGEDKSLAVLSEIANDRKLFTYFHDGYWQCMDTMRDVRILREKWDSGKADWVIWK